MNVTVGELMSTPVMTVTRHETDGHAADLMRMHHVSALPVVGPDHEPLGIITATDLLADRSEATTVSNFMSSPAITVPVNEGPHVAARIMRNHHVHHIVVVDDHRVVGIVARMTCSRWWRSTATRPRRHRPHPRSSRSVSSAGSGPQPDRRTDSMTAPTRSLTPTSSDRSSTSKAPEWRSSRSPPPIGSWTPRRT